MFQSTAHRIFFYKCSISTTYLHLVIPRVQGNSTKICIAILSNNSLFIAPPQKKINKNIVKNCYYFLFGTPAVPTISLSTPSLDVVDSMFLMLLIVLLLFIHTINLLHYLSPCVLVDIKRKRICPVKIPVRFLIKKTAIIHFAYNNNYYEAIFGLRKKKSMLKLRVMDMILEKNFD